MREKRVAVICLILMLFTSVAAPVTAEESHQNFDDAETDLTALVMALNRTQSLMNMSLNASRSVDYHQQLVNGSDFNNSRVRYGYERESLNSSIELSQDSSQSIEAARYILDDIEGEVSSYEYLKELYTPFYGLSSNLSGFTDVHLSILSDITRAVEIYNNVAAGSTSMSRLIQGVEILHGARSKLREMNTSLHRMKGNIDLVNESYLDMDPLAEGIEATYPLLEEYEKHIEELLRWISALYEYRYDTWDGTGDGTGNGTGDGYFPPSLSNYISLYVPEEVHPGGAFAVDGFYVEDNKYRSGVEIVLVVDGNSTVKAVTDGGGHYEIEYTIPWNRSLGEMMLRTESLESGITSQNRSVEVVRYSSRVVIRSDRWAYYRQNITIEGSFSTDAPVPLNGTVLNWSHGENFSTEGDGSFMRLITYPNLTWGPHTVTVSYGGNRTIEPAEGTTNFEISVPTDITLQANTTAVYSQDDNITMNGTLLNVSSGSGIPAQNVSLLINGDTRLDNRTNGSGVYRFSLELADISQGLHRLETTYRGTRIYRNCSSAPLYLYKEGGYVILGSDPDDVEQRMEDHLDDDSGSGDDGGSGDDWPPWEDPLGGSDGDVYELLTRYWFFLASFLFVLFVVVFHILSRREKEEESQKEDFDGEAGPVSGTVRTKKKKPELFHADSETEIPAAYHQFTEKLDEEKVIELEKGTTHRDIARALVKQLDMKEEIQSVTDIFEKAYFSGRRVMKKELNLFNSALKKIMGGAST